MNILTVVFRTNIDVYKDRHPFPTHMTEVPRKGEKVRVLSKFEPYFQNLKLPICLEVVDVMWTERMYNPDADEWETIAYVELWYNQTDKQLADLAGAKTL